jgi:4-hydroxyphenylpyruvate dioxygenase
MPSVNAQNPIGLDGVDFVEYSGPDMQALDSLFRRMGFKEVASLKDKQIRLFRQGDINFILNTEPGTFAKDFSKLHGACIASVGFRVFDAEAAFSNAVARGAKPFVAGETRSGATPFRAVYGIGDSVIYFVDQKNSEKLYSQTFKVRAEDKSPIGFGLKIVDHFTNNVPRGDMNKWCEFYEKVFNFRQTLTFDIRGAKTGLESKVMRSPCGKFSVPINEPTDTKSQIQEYLEEYKGSGIQHLALTTDNIIATLETMKSSQISFLTPPPSTYYAALKDRVPNVIEDVQRLEKNAVLVDGDHHGYLLQIFTKNVIGPIFYELIQRKGHEGFGEGNFQALFDAIERDQRERGYLD